MRPLSGLDLANHIAALNDAVDSTYKFDEIRALVQLRAMLDACLREAVSDYRTCGATWEDCARALMVSRQAAQQRFR